MIRIHRALLLAMLTAALAGCAGNAASHRGAYVGFSGGVNGL